MKSYQSINMGEVSSSVASPGLIFDMQKAVANLVKAAYLVTVFDKVRYRYD